jgi:dTDP-4-dehydrorhamnose reductase
VTRILLLGRTGQVGWELNRSLQFLGEVLAPSRNEADFSKLKTLRKLVKESHADIIINAVAYNAVDKAESEESLARAINADAPGVLAEEAKRTSALLVHYSTDYVFDGEKTSPYVEEDNPNPINAYGRSKLAGELNIAAASCAYLNLRTSWVYSSRGQNFVKTILSLANQRDELRIVADQIGAPTSARFIADITTAVLAKLRPKQKLPAHEVSGTFHLTPANNTSWHGVAQLILDSKRSLEKNVTRVPTLIPIPTEQYPLPAPRPKNSRLNCNKLSDLFGIHLPSWETHLRLCLDELAE